MKKTEQNLDILEKFSLWFGNSNLRKFRGGVKDNIDINFNENMTEDLVKRFVEDKYRLF